jgi:hypothetical protein
LHGKAQWHVREGLAADSCGRSSGLALPWKRPSAPDSLLADQPIFVLLKAVALLQQYKRAHQWTKHHDFAQQQCLWKPAHISRLSRCGNLL